MDWFTLFTTAMRLAPKIQADIATGVSFKTVTNLITDPDLLSAFTTIGGQLFPDVRPQLQTVAAIVTAYSPDHTKWIQGSLNALVKPSPNLVVDGVYGKATIAAVKGLQKQLGVALIDGWAGDITSAAIQTALASLSK